MAEQSEMAKDLGRYLKAQREIAQLSLRHLARLSKVSDSYLSQLERGLYQPSPDVLRAVATGLGIQPDALYRRMGWLDDADAASEAEGPASGVLDAIAADERLSAAQKSALTQTYQAMVGDV